MKTSLALHFVAAVGPEIGKHGIGLCYSSRCRVAFVVDRRIVDCFVVCCIRLSPVEFVAVRSLGFVVGGLRHKTIGPLGQKISAKRGLARLARERGRCVRSLGD